MANGFWGLSWFDYGVILLYFGVTIVLGLRAGKKVKNQEDYFLGGRKFGKWIQTFAMFGQATSTDSVVNVSTMVARDGAAGMMANLITGLFYMPILWITAPWYRRARQMTMADVYGERYQSRGIAVTYALVSAIFFLLVSGAGYLAMGKTVAAIMQKPDAALTQFESQQRAQALELKALEARDAKLLTTAEKAQLDTLREAKPKSEFSYVDKFHVMIFIALCVLFYVAVGGLEAAFRTDLIQGILIIVLTVLLIPFAMLRINAVYGGTEFISAFQIMHQQLPEWYFQLMGSPKLMEFTWYWILAFGLVGVVNTAVQANQLTVIAAAKDENAARVGATNGLFIKRYSFVVWGLVALLAFVLYGSAVSDADYLWGMATRELLGPVGFGLVGLMIACLFAALMSTASALALSTAALITRSVYKPLVPNKSETHYVTVGRWFSSVYIFGGLLVAWGFEQSIFDLVKYMVLFNAVVAAAFWLGMTWRRANTQAVWASMIVTALLTVVLPILVPLIPGVRENTAWHTKTAKRVVTSTYQARQGDIVERDTAIVRWDSLQTAGLAEGTRPASLQMGQTFEKEFIQKQKSIFWWKDVKTTNGVTRGQGMLFVDLALLDALGVDLTQYTYSTLQTITIANRLIVPFGILFLVALLTKPQEKKHLDYFFAKLKTPVYPDKALDEVEIARTQEDPARYEKLKLFPGSNWEFRRWDRGDWSGVFINIAGALGVVVLLVIITRLGG